MTLIKFDFSSLNRMSPHSFWFVIQQGKNGRNFAGQQRYRKPIRHRMPHCPIPQLPQQKDRTWPRNEFSPSILLPTMSASPPTASAACSDIYFPACLFPAPRIKRRWGKSSRDAKIECRSEFSQFLTHYKNVTHKSLRVSISKFITITTGLCLAPCAVESHSKTSQFCGYNLFIGVQNMLNPVLSLWYLICTRGLHTVWGIVREQLWHFWHRDLIQGPFVIDSKDYFPSVAVWVGKARAQCTRPQVQLVSLTMLTKITRARHFPAHKTLPGPYYRNKLERLLDVKAKYDPQSIFLYAQGLSQHRVMPVSLKGSVHHQVPTFKWPYCPRLPGCRKVNVNMLVNIISRSRNWWCTTGFTVLPMPDG